MRLSGKRLLFSKAFGALLSLSGAGRLPSVPRKSPRRKSPARRQPVKARARAVVLPPAEQLCKICQLCCNGSLFRHLYITPDEALRLEKDVRAVIYRKQHALCLPCPALEDGRCGVFEKRAAGCGRFVCVLQMKVSDGRVPLEQALPIVREAQRLIAIVADELPAEPGDDPDESVMQRADRRLTSSALEMPDRARQANHEARAFMHKHLLDAGF